MIIYTASRRLRRRSLVGPRRVAIASGGRKESSIISDLCVVRRSKFYDIIAPRFQLSITHTPEIGPTPLQRPNSTTSICRRFVGRQVVEKAAMQLPGKLGCYGFVARLQLCAVQLVVVNDSFWICHTDCRSACCRTKSPHKLMQVEFRPQYGAIIVEHLGPAARISSFLDVDALLAAAADCDATRELITFCSTTNAGLA